MATWEIHLAGRGIEVDWARGAVCRVLIGHQSQEAERDEFRESCKVLTKSTPYCELGNFCVKKKKKETHRYLGPRIWVAG
jgi:hypothetical protein